MVLAVLLLTLIAALPVGAAGKSSASLKIVAFGDSLTSGHRLARMEAYPSILQAKLKSAGLPVTVVNKGVSGDTTARALRRLNSALEEQPQILILELGVNDGLRGVPVPQVKGNLAMMIEAAQAQDIQVLLCAMEALPLQGWQYTIDFHRMYDELAAQYRVPLVPFVMNGVLGNRDLISDDGVHPNAAGARVIAERIWEYVQPMARRLAAATTPGTR